MKLAFILAVAAIALTATAAPAAAARWVLLHEMRSEIGSTDRYRDVNSDQSYSHVKFCADGGSLYIRSVTFVFILQDKTSVLQANLLVRDGRCTRAIALEGGPRAIDSITLSCVVRAGRPKLGVFAK
jgi:hypothetical protein